LEATNGLAAAFLLFHLCDARIRDTPSTSPAVAAERLRLAAPWALRDWTALFLDACGRGLLPVLRRLLRAADATAAATGASSPQPGAVPFRLDAVTLRRGFAVCIGCGHDAALALLLDGAPWRQLLDLTQRCAILGDACGTDLPSTVARVLAHPGFLGDTGAGGPGDDNAGVPDAAVQLSAYSFDREIFDMLLAADLPRVAYSRALVAAAEHGDEFAVATLLADGRVDPQWNNWEAFFASCEGGWMDIIRTFLHDPRIDLAHPDLVRRGHEYGAFEDEAVVNLLRQEAGLELDEPITQVDAGGHMPNQSRLGRGGIFRRGRGGASRLSTRLDDEALRFQHEFAGTRH
ncbi:hypothetical protein HK405_003144, partial [Cladochytrium tenue]